MKTITKNLYLLDLAVLMVFYPFHAQSQSELNEVLFDGLHYSSLQSTDLILSGDSLLIVNEDTGAFSINVDLEDATSYALWYSFPETVGAYIAQNYLGISGDSLMQSFGTSTLKQISNEEYEATIFIPGSDTLEFKAYWNDTVVYEGFILNGASVNYIRKPDGSSQKPRYDSKVEYIDQPGDRPDIVLIVHYISEDSKKARLLTPGGSVPFDVIQIYPTIPYKDSLSLTAVSISVAGLSNLVFNRAIAMNADQLLTFCPGDSVSLSITTAESATYQWQRNFIDISEEQSDNYQAKESGEYRVKVTTNGTTYISNEVLVTVDENLSNCDPTSYTGSIPSSEFNISLFPNPTTVDITMELNAPAIDGLSLCITGLYGNVLVNKAATIGNVFQKIEVNDLPQGMYFLQILSKGQVIAVNKFVKQ